MGHGAPWLSDQSVDGQRRSAPPPPGVSDGTIAIILFKKFQ
jgi:hypothetical protein